jgi:hypothetical protein
MKMNKLFIFIFSFLFITSLAFAGDELEEIQDNFTFNADVHVGAHTKKSFKDGLGIPNSTIGFKGQIDKYLKLVLTMQMPELKEEQVDDFVKEAYFEFQILNNRPLLFIIGKQAMPFGLNIDESTFHDLKNVDILQKIDEVWGAVISLESIDKKSRIEIGAFINEQNKKNKSELTNFAVRVDRYLSEDTLFSASFVTKNTNESRLSVGLFGQTRDGALIGWIEGILFSNNPMYPNSHVAIDAGVKYQIHPMVRVVFNYNYVENVSHEFTYGIEAQLDKNLMLELEVGTEYRADKSWEYFAGARLSYLLR